MLTATEFNALLDVAGEPVTYRQAKSPQATYSIRAIVQDMSRAPEAIVNAYGLAGRSVQFIGQGFAVPPEKFDSVTRANGERITLDLVNPQLQRGTGTVAYHVAYGKGAA